MSINNLPPELLHYILNLVTASSKPFSEPNVVLRNKEYYRTALVCKSWNQHATPMLYIAVRIYYANPCSRFLRNLETTNLGQCIKTLRLEYVCWTAPKMWHGRDVMSELLWKLGELAPNLNNLCIIGRQAIEDAWLFGLKNLVKLVLWGAEIKFTLPLDSTHVLPSLRHLSICKVSDIMEAAEMFNPRVLPSLEFIAMVEMELSDTLGGDDILSQVPLDTLIVTSDEVRRSLGQGGNEMTVYTDRFYAFTNWWTALGEEPPYPRHLYCTDFGGSYFDEFSDFIHVLGPIGVKYLETIYLPAGTQEAEEDTRMMEAWCKARGIRLIFEPDFNYVHESHVLDSFVKLYEEKKREKDRKKVRAANGMA